MKFNDRTNELQLLAQIWEQSTRNACFTVLVGRRRVGKTALLLKSAENQKMLYLFVSRNCEAVLCQQFQQQATELLGLQVFGSISKLVHLFEQLLIYARTEHYSLIIDEFQDFERVNPAIFSEMQNIWDKYKDEVKLKFIACGSINSFMTKIFENNNEPLFGRLTSKIVLKPFPIKVLKQILKDFNPDFTPDDLLFLYALTGGVSLYIALLMNARATTQEEMLDFATRFGSPFLTEGKDLLVSEFGKDYSTYFSILQLIASGKTTQSEIDSIIGKNTGAYLANLENNYSLIVKNKPMFSKPESRNTRWAIDDNFLRFWFRFVYPNQNLIEMGRNDLLKRNISNDYDCYSGLLLEKYFCQKFAEEETVTEIGRYWDRKGDNEIDLIATNDFEKTATIAEVKRNFKKINLNTLAMKTASIRAHLTSYQVELKALSLNQM